MSNLFLWFNAPFIVDTIFEDSLKRNLKVLEVSSAKIKKERRVYFHLLTLIFILPSKLVLLTLVILGYLYLKPYFTYGRKMKQLQAQLHYEFPIWIRSIQCHLQSSNVVVSIEKSYDYAPSLVKHHLKDLIWKLSCDPHNVVHYESFMQEYQNYEIEKMMKFLYRFNHMAGHQGEKHLDRMIESTGLWMDQTRMKKQEDKVDQFSIFGILPVVVVSFYFLIMMSLVIVSMMEGGWML